MGKYITGVQRMSSLAFAYMGFSSFFFFFREREREREKCIHVDFSCSRRM
jgi:hypothetical protein